MKQKEKLFKQAVHDPSTMFKSPFDLAKDTGLSYEQKIALLKNWAWDTQELLVAEDENMSLEQRMAALEEMWQRDSAAQARQLQILTAELARERALRNGVTPQREVGKNGSATEEDWARVSPDWKERTRGR